MFETIPADPDAALAAIPLKPVPYSGHALRQGATGLLLLAILITAPAVANAQNRGSARDAWNHPAQVLDDLGIHPESVVADVGCGRGYFTFRMAKRVGPAGKVYAVDLDESWIEQIRKRAAAEGLKQIVAIQGKPDNPELPVNSLDVVFAMNTYHEWRQNEAMLSHILRALKPGGLFALIDGKAPTGHSREYYHFEHRMPESMERADALHTGFVFLRQLPGFTQPDDQKQFYFLVFQKPAAH
ncbi:MAG: class I SAM-dependent methyltransferase [Terriglobia bacterium]